MSDLISRKELIETIGNIRARYGNDNSSLIEQGEVLDLIAEAPSVDAEPMKHGHWILEKEPNGKPYCFHCSVCDDDFHYIGILSAYPYCPNCGAKMDEVSE